MKDSYDIDGVTFGQAMMAIAQPNEIKAISYMWREPASHGPLGRRSDRGAREPHAPSFASFSNRGSLRILLVLDLSDRSMPRLSPTAPRAQQRHWRTR
jgi:hypothetical protein